MENIEITVNGESREVAADCRMEDLLQDLKLDAKHLAVAVDENVIPRQDWARRRLQAGEQVEIVHFVGGGGE